MQYSLLSKDKKEAKKPLSIVNKALRSDKKPFQTQTAYPRFRVDNMVFIEVHTAPTAEVRDLNGSSSYVVVVLDEGMRLVRLPNKELFARFASLIRAAPDLMAPHHKLRTALTLATGNGDYTSSTDKSEPSWVDEDGILVIKYYAYIRQMSSMVRPRIALRTLTVDENQNYSIKSQDVGHEIP